MRLSRAQRPTPLGLPLTSLIDVVFLLLIYFIVTSTLTPPEDDLSAGLRADSQAAGRAADLQPQIVTVELLDGLPVFRLAERRFSDQESLRATLASLPKEGGVFLRVDDAAPVGAAASAWQAARDAGFTKVTYVTPR